MYPKIIIGSTVIESWTLCLSLSYIVVVILLLLNRPKDYPATRAQIFWGSLIYFFMALWGAVLLHIILYFNRYRGLPINEVFNRAGTAYLGAPALGLLAVWLYFRGLIKVSFLRAIDYVAPYLMLERTIGRIGCLLTGCCYGIPTTLPWGFKFLSDGISRHPTQAYAMTCAFAVFCSSRFIYKNLREFRGFSFFYVIFMYSFLRFFNEFLRAEGPRIAGQLKLSHPFLLLFMIGGIIGMLKAIKPAEPEQRRIIKKTFKTALLRLFIWLICSTTFLLAIIYIANRMM